MPVVRVKGVANPMQFPDDMDINDIREFLRRRFISQMGEGQPDLAPIESVAQEVKPSLAERAGQGISNALYDSGIISDRYGAQRIGSNLSSIGEFLPVIGDATAGDEFGRALKKGNYGDAAIAGIGSVPILGDMAIFAGVMAKNADLRLLKKAKSLEKSGAGRDEIWKETGWANDQGDWKFEISDYLDFDTGKGADINPSSFNIIKDYGGTTNENFMGHPELYDAYPNLKDRPIRSVAGSGGQYSIGTDTVSIGDKLLSPTSGVGLSNTQSVNLHELQHAIQSREGFASGGNPEQFIGRYNSAPERIKDANYSAELKGLLDEGVPESEILDLYKGMPEEGFVRDLWSNQKDFIKGESVDYFNKLARVAKSDLIPPSDKYERLAGEAEARNVQKRMNMTPEQRRATPPWQTLDVPEDELIYRKGGTNKAMSVGDAAINPLDEFTSLMDKTAARREARLKIYDLPTKGAAESINDITDLFDYTPEQLVSQMKTLDNAGIRRGGYLKKGDNINVFYSDDGTSQMINPKTNEVIFDNDIEQTTRLIKDDILTTANGKLTQEQKAAAYQARKANDEAARAREAAQKDTYKMQHTAPMRGDNPSGDDLSPVYGEDIYSPNALRYYGTNSSYDGKAINIIKAMKGNPDKEITIYRAVPKSITEINNSDWITTTKEYAQDHMKGEKGWHVISKKVKAKDIASDGNSIHEFGYDPVLNIKDLLGGAAKKGYRGISSANKRIDPNITWFSADEKLAKGYSDTNKAFSADLNIKRPFDAGDDKNTTTPLRFANQALSQMGADNIDKKTAMLIKADFLSNYPDPRKEVRVIDFWASDDGKDNVANMLQDLGFDAVRLKEEGVETYGMIRMKAE
jgi:hypothetical protein